MVGSLEQLALLLEPPAAVSTPVPWDRSVPEIGIRFPLEYCQFIDRFGPGTINGEMAIWAPLAQPAGHSRPAGMVGFLHRTTEELGPYLAESREELPEQYPYPAFPEPKGLLAWADCPNGLFCFWLMEDDDPNSGRSSCGIRAPASGTASIAPSSNS